MEQCHFLLDKEIEELNEKIKKIGPGRGKVNQKKQEYEEKRDRKMIVKMKLRYNKECQVCGAAHFEMKNGVYSEVHHLISWAIGHDDSKENLVVVCANCHKKFDHAKDEEKRTMYERLKSRFPGINYRIPYYIN